MKYLKDLILITIIALSLDVNSQIDLSEPDRINCGTAILHNERLASNPWIQKVMDKQNEFAKEYAKSFTSNKKGVISYTIPLVYHVIHDNGPENVSKAAIDASVANLNEDFQKLNSDLSSVVASFTGIAADIEIQFRLAHIDPNGNCTEGITRTVSDETYAMTESAKSIVNWNTTKYLNIWVGQTMASGSGGWSYYPGTAPSQNNEGIVIRSAQLGNSISHEVGHFLNLPHTWGSSNTPGQAGNCNLDDGVADTPETMGNQSCNTAGVSCGTLDNVQNYMDYSGCTRMFTEGQKTRMHAALNSSWGSRNTLWANSNLIATGVADPYNVAICVPEADFSNDRNFICEGESVNYFDYSYNASPTSWNWTFTGGTPNNSNLENPIIQYNTPGVYGVTHQPSTSAGAGSVSENNVVTVSSLTASYSGIIVDGFENATNFNNDWIIRNLDDGNQQFSRITTTAATGNASVRIMNRFISEAGEKHELISPSYDLTTLSNPTFNFKFAFARRATSNTDRLLIWYSLDCGSSWSLAMAPMQGSSMSTIGSSLNNTVWVPGANDWVTKTASLNSISSESNVRFKFAFDSGLGNNLYIDDINIDGTLSVEDELSGITSFNVYPNPTSSSAKISFNLIKEVQNLSITVRNAVGQVVTNVINDKSFSAGKYSLRIDEEKKLSSGIYFIEMNTDGNIKVEKLIVR
jgi:hypothetical protein